jgi:hypothetical protein
MKVSTRTEGRGGRSLISRDHSSTIPSTHFAIPIPSDILTSTLSDSDGLEGRGDEAKSIPAMDENVTIPTARSDCNGTVSFQLERVQARNNHVVGLGAPRLQLPPIALPYLLFFHRIGEYCSTSNLDC